MVTDLDRAIREALATKAEGLDVPDWDAVKLVTDTDRRRARRHRRPDRRQLLPVLAVAAVLAVVAATAIGIAAYRSDGDKQSVATPAGATYMLPSNGWKPGDGTRQARIAGPFHAALTSRGACAWIGEQVPSQWPEGWSVRFGPIELIDPNGHVFAREGDLLVAAGGLTTPANAPTQCSGDVNNALSLTTLKRGG